MLLLKQSDTFSASAHFEYCESTVSDQTKSHRKRWTSPKGGSNLAKCVCVSNFYIELTSCWLVSSQDVIST